MKIIIILLICCFNIFLASKDMPRDAALEKPIMDLVKAKNTKCSEYKSLVQAFLDKFKKEITGEDNKMCKFTCASDEHFNDAVTFCTNTNCEFPDFIKVLGENSSVKMFDCDVKTVIYKFQKAAKKIMFSSIDVKVCDNKKPLPCFFRLATIQNELDCTKYKNYLEPGMNEKVKGKGYKDCKLICETDKAKERFKALIDYARKQVMAKDYYNSSSLKSVDEDQRKFLADLEKQKDKLPEVYDDVIHAIFKRSGDEALAKCTEGNKRKMK